jgi:thioredoxin 1
MRLNRPRLFAWSIAFILVFSLSISLAEDFSKVPAKGVVTMVDLGAKKCIPCKMMAPILAKLEKAYEGKAAIVFIDVWENKEQAPRFKVRAIPTQIFFNEKGKEVFRHVGFFDEKSIVEQLNKMGIENPGLKKQG